MAGAGGPDRTGELAVGAVRRVVPLLVAWVGQDHSTGVAWEGPAGFSRLGGCMTFSGPGTVRWHAAWSVGTRFGPGVSPQQGPFQPYPGVAQPYGAAQPAGPAQQAAHGYAPGQYPPGRHPNVAAADSGWRWESVRDWWSWL